MTEQQENILNRKINGLTWGLALSIVTTFGAGAVWVVKGYMRIETMLTKSAIQYDGMQGDINHLATRIDRQDEKIYNLVIQNKK